MQSGALMRVQGTKGKMDMRTSPVSATDGASAPAYSQWNGTFPVRSADLDAEGRVGPATLIGFLQEGAASHARQLGVGLQALQAVGRTWMLVRMRVLFLGWPGLNDLLAVRTWPTGARGQTVAYRDYEGRNGAGDLIVKAASEWVLVDVDRLRIARLTPEIAALAPRETPRVDLPEAISAAAGWTPAWRTCLPVRRADLDVNRHVNNVHYVEWLFEPLPASWLARRLTRVEIAYKTGAVQGDTVVSAAAAAGASTLVHQLTRQSDGAILAEATTAWKG
jgi:medium-chain acyl-[acyl-carrier-protein] hydrolase